MGAIQVEIGIDNRYEVGWYTLIGILEFILSIINSRFWEYNTNNKYKSIVLWLYCDR